MFSPSNFWLKIATVNFVQIFTWSKHTLNLSDSCVINCRVYHILMVEPQPVRAAFPFYITPMTPSVHGNLPGNTIQKRSCHWFCYGIPDSTNVVLRSIPIFAYIKIRFPSGKLSKNTFHVGSPATVMRWRGTRRALLCSAKPRPRPPRPPPRLT